MRWEGNRYLGDSSAERMRALSCPVWAIEAIDAPGNGHFWIEHWSWAVFSLGFCADKILIMRLSTQRWLDVGSNWTTDNHQSQDSSLSYEYRVTCSSHYYGKGCENLCRPRNDSFGHYSCNPNGNRVCLSGWKGDYCNLREYPRKITKNCSGEKRRTPGALSSLLFTVVRDWGEKVLQLGATNKCLTLEIDSKFLNLRINVIFIIS